MLYDDGWHKYATAISWVGGVEKVTSMVTRTDDFLADTPKKKTTIILYTITIMLCSNDDIKTIKEHIFRARLGTNYYYLYLVLNHVNLDPPIVITVLLCAPIQIFSFSGHPYFDVILPKEIMQ